MTAEISRRHLIVTANVDMSASSSCIAINGETLNLLAEGAAFWPAREALIVADLHFEKGSSFARRGVMLPPYDTRTTLRRLAAVADRIKPRVIISLGDAFHDRGAEARMDDDDADLLGGLIARHSWLWVLGNHDPAPPERFAGAVERSLRLGGLFLTHEPTATPQAGELAGHLHPCGRFRTGEKTLRRRCFIEDGGRMILPAFGAYTGGLNVRDAAIADLFQERRRIWAMGAKGVYPFDWSSCAPEAPPLHRKAG